MKNRWIALLLAAAVVCLPAWLALKLTGADAPAETAGQPVLVTAMARAGAMEETALSAAEPLAAALEHLRADIAETAEKSIHLTPPAEIDLGWWQSHYSDIIGYVYSPGTPISYPIAYDGNNEYYLHHDLYGNYSEYGTIFLDARVPSDFSGQNNVLYGHHMADGSMFASISNYKQQWYYDAHPYYYVYTSNGNYRVDLFAGIIVPGEHEVFSTSLSTSQLQRFISESTFYSGKGVPSGQIMTLCTCSYEAANYRYVVLGEMIPLADSTAEETNT